ncbi:MAG TPA: hypothetical protein VE130_09590, partial [Nitrososphaeraceae archaeon]|nr:hypothetical protein [Nitrososphaeraceae archaeon]
SNTTTKGTISKQTFECYVCKKQGFNNERVYLAGKDSNGRTIYLETDGVTAHRHKFKERTPGETQPTTLATSADTIVSKLDEINSKLDRLLAKEEAESKTGEKIKQ